MFNDSSYLTLKLGKIKETIESYRWDSFIRFWFELLYSNLLRCNTSTGGTAANLVVFSAAVWKSVRNKLDTTFFRLPHIYNLDSGRDFHHRVDTWPQSHSVIPRVIQWDNRSPPRLPTRRQETRRSVGPHSHSYTKCNLLNQTKQKLQETYRATSLRRGPESPSW